MVLCQFVATSIATLLAMLNLSLTLKVVSWCTCTFLFCKQSAPAANLHKSVLLACRQLSSPAFDSEADWLAVSDSLTKVFVRIVGWLFVSLFLKIDAD